MLNAQVCLIALQTTNVQQLQICQTDSKWYLSKIGSVSGIRRSAVIRGTCSYSIQSRNWGAPRFLTQGQVIIPIMTKAKPRARRTSGSVSPLLPWRRGRPEEDPLGPPQRLCLFLDLGLGSLLSLCSDPDLAFLHLGLRTECKHDKMVPARAAQPLRLFKCRPSLLKNFISLSIVSIITKLGSVLPRLRLIRSLKWPTFESTKARSNRGGILQINNLPAKTSLIFVTEACRTSSKDSGVTSLFLRSLVPPSSTIPSTS